MKTHVFLLLSIFLMLGTSSCDHRPSHNEVMDCLTTCANQRDGIMNTYDRCIDAAAAAYQQGIEDCRQTSSGDALVECLKLKKELYQQQLERCRTERNDQSKEMLGCEGRCYMPDKPVNQ